jgi:chromosome segregation ATPase
MNGNMKSMWGLVMLGCLLPLMAQAAPREAGKQDNGAVQKLQGMVKSLTTERDAAKAETTKLTAELEQLKKDSSKSLATATAAQAQLDSELSSQKTSNTEVRDRLDKTNARLLEVIDKYKELSQSKNQLGAELTGLKARQEATEQQLNICGEHNVKLLNAAKELLVEYENKGSISSVLQQEPLLKFKSVEMETIVQDYEDKLNAGVYKK